MVAVIQIGSFCATLARKNLVPHPWNVWGYGVALTLGAALACYEHTVHGDARGAILLLGNCAAVLRMEPWSRNNKNTSALVVTMRNNKYCT